MLVSFILQFVAVMLGSKVKLAPHQYEMSAEKDNGRANAEMGYRIKQ